MPAFRRAWELGVGAIVELDAAMRAVNVDALKPWSMVVIWYCSTARPSSRSLPARRLCRPTSFRLT